MRAIWFVLFCFISLSAFAQQKIFGDQVVECAAKYRLPVDSPRLHEVFEICEKEVSRNQLNARPDSVTLGEVFTNCLAESSALLDDLISSAFDIARAVAAECQMKWLAVLKTSNSPPSEWANRMQEYPSKTVTDVALRAVLVGRRTALTQGKIPARKSN